LAPVTDGQLVIRPATGRDQPAIFALYRDLEGVYDLAEHGDDPGEEALWETVAADTRQQILVAEHDGRVTGSLTIVIVPNLGHRGRPWAAVENVVVAPEARGRGVGTTMMRRATEIARSHGCYKVVLSSNVNRPEAHRFYENLGWRLTHAGFSVDL